MKQTARPECLYRTMYRSYKMDREQGPDNSQQTQDSMDRATDAPDTPGSRPPAKTFKSSVVIIPPDECWEQIQAIREVHDKGYERWMPHINLVYPFLEDQGDVFESAASVFQRALSNTEPFTIKFTKDCFRYFAHKKFCTLWLKPEVLKTASDQDASEAVPSSETVSSQRTPNETGGETSATAGIASSTGENGASASTQIHGSEENNTSPFVSKSKSKKQQKKENKTKYIEEKNTAELESAGPNHPQVVGVQRLLEAEFPECDDVSKISERGFTPHLSLGQFSHKDVDTFREQFKANWRDIEFQVREVCLISRKDFHDPFHVRFAVPLGSSSNTA